MVNFAKSFITISGICQVYSKVLENALFTIADVVGLPPINWREGRVLYPLPLLFIIIVGSSAPVLSLMI